MTGEAIRPRDDEMEATVADYLAAHPDFFHRYPDLAAAMTMPHPVHDKTVSLVERQVGLLREQKVDLKHKLHHLSQVARDNEHLLQRLEKLILELLDCVDVSGVRQRLETAMRRDFHADAVTLWLFAPASGVETVARSDARMKPFERLMAQGTPACGVLPTEQSSALFGDESDLASGAIIPLCDGEGECLGLLAIGSVDPRRYHAEMGTAFLAHLGAVMARVIRTRLV